jgi:hypothetical protein
MARMPASVYRQIRPAVGDNRRPGPSIHKQASTTHIKAIRCGGLKRIKGWPFQCNAKSSSIQCASFVGETDLADENWCLSLHVMYIITRSSGSGQDVIVHGLPPLHCETAIRIGTQLKQRFQHRRRIANGREGEKRRQDGTWVRGLPARMACTQRFFLKSLCSLCSRWEIKPRSTQSTQRFFLKPLCSRWEIKPQSTAWMMRTAPGIIFHHSYCVKWEEAPLRHLPITAVHWDASVVALPGIVKRWCLVISASRGSIETC